MKTKLLILLLLFVSSIAHVAARDTLVVKNGKVTVVQVDSVKQRNTKPAEKVGDFPVNGKTVTVYRGPKGGYFYFTGKVAKNGKPEKKYLKDLDKKSKKQ